MAREGPGGFDGGVAHGASPAARAGEAAAASAGGGAGEPEPEMLVEPEPEMPTEGDLEKLLEEVGTTPAMPGDGRWKEAQGAGGIGVSEPRQTSGETTVSQHSHHSAASGSSAGAAPDVTSAHAWSPAEVAQWLRCIGLSHCAETLLANAVGGAALLGIPLAENPSADLVALGLRALGDRKRLLKAIKQLEVDSAQVTTSQDGPWSLHFMFMSASPLVELGPHGASPPLKALDVESEQTAICQATADAGVACRFQCVNATLRTLSWAVLHQSCCVLIFSGYTLPNGQWMLETETGEALPFEPLDMLPQEGGSSASGSSGAARFQPPPRVAGDEPAERFYVGEGVLGPGSRTASASSLTALSRPQAAGGRGRSGAPAARFRLVVLHAPHPHISAQRFLDAGVPHVITVQRSAADAAGTDSSAAVFLQMLCRSLLRGGSVQQAFAQAERIAKQAEDATIFATGSASPSSGRPSEPAAEDQGDQRFALLPAGSDHSEVLMPELSRGLPVRCSPARSIGQFPRTGLDLVNTRRLEMWRVLRALRCRRLVQVLGPPGVGKRTLACLIANFVWQRNLFPDGVHYVHVDDLHQLSRRASRTAAGSTGEAESGGAGGGGEPEGGATTVDGFLGYTPALPGHKLLLLDGCEELYHRGCHDSFIDWLSRLLSENPHLQLLITAETHLPVSNDRARDPLLGSLEDHTVEVRPLPEEHAVQFLQWFCRGHEGLRRLASDELQARRVVDLCGGLPYTIGLFTRWAALQQPSEDAPACWVRALEAEIDRGGGPPAQVVSTAGALRLVVGGLPLGLEELLRTLARQVDSSFTVDDAAATWGLPLSEAQVRIATLRSWRLLEAAESGAMATRLVSPPGEEAEAASLAPTTFRMHTLLREYCRDPGGQRLRFRRRTLDPPAAALAAESAQAEAGEGGSAASGGRANTGGGVAPGQAAHRGPVGRGDPADGAGGAVSQAAAQRRGEVPSSPDLLLRRGAAVGSVGVPAAPAGAGTGVTVPCTC